jgi:putative flavoprotein involved in K+ transport
MNDIEAALQDSLDSVAARDFEVTTDPLAPAIVSRAGQEVTEAIFRFSTSLGNADGVVRLIRESDGQYRALTLLTALRNIRDHEPTVGARRPRTDQSARFFPRSSQSPESRSDLVAETHPTVLVVGAGHFGLSLAAELGVRGVDTLVVERNEAVGDNWRKRYDSLVLHTLTSANHLPFLPFPESFPDYIPKDRLGDWLETYARIMDLPVRTSTSFIGGLYDHASETWTAHLRCGDSDITVQPRHLVLAVGLSGSPHLPKIDGVADFQGSSLHSSEFISGEAFRGQAVVVFGAGNSGCDVAQDLFAHGAAVTMIQRGPTTVLNLPTKYSDQLSADRVNPGFGGTAELDLLAMADPYPAFVSSQQWMTKLLQEANAKLTADLTRAGFQTWYGEDQTGSQLAYLRRGGGYYIDVGLADEIVAGNIAVRNFDEIERIEANGILYTDGTRSYADTIIYATGYAPLASVVRQLLGPSVVDALGQIWGFDDSGEVSNMFRRTKQPGLWLVAGGLPHARWYCRLTALQIQAIELGLLPKSLSA